MPTRFDRDTAVEPLGEGRYAARIDRGWWVQAGPNGGYCSALLLRAMWDFCGDAERPPRSLSARYLLPPKEGACEIQVRIVRKGRSMTVLDADMFQEGTLMVRGTASFAGAFSEISFQDASMPDCLPIEQCQPIEKRIPMNERYSMWRGIGGELRQSDRALTGGWIRLEEPRSVDACLLALLWDAWPPAPFARRMTQRFRGAAPTVEVAMQFKRRVPLPDADPAAHLLLRVESTTADEGFVEESAEIWSPDGLLLLQSRQMALLI